MIFKNSPPIDKRFRVPRIWSNKELKKFSSLFNGDIVNVSAWTDVDKEGDYYKNYFKNAKSYSITNFDKDKRGWQGLDGEIFLDLEKTLPKDIKGKFDVVFNHTTLEHIYQVNTAFANLCLMSKDIVIIVVPFLQEYHSDYGDYWRFSPQAIERLFKDNGLTLIYLNFNDEPYTSIYMFAIGSKKPNYWKKRSEIFKNFKMQIDLKRPPGYYALPDEKFKGNLLKKFIRFFKEDE